MCARLGVCTRDDARTTPHALLQPERAGRVARAHLPAGARLAAHRVTPARLELLGLAITPPPPARDAAALAFRSLLHGIGREAG